MGGEVAALSRFVPLNVRENYYTHFSRPGRERAIIVSGGTSRERQIASRPMLPPAANAAFGLLV